MKANLKVNTRGLSRLLRDMERAGPAASLEAVKVMGREFAKVVLVLSPTDTHRYKRGWSEAINTAGIGPVSVPAIQKSQYAEKLLDRLEIQVDRFAARMENRRKAAEYWEKVYQNRYARPGRKGQWERDCATKRDRAVKNYEIAQKQHARAVEQVKNFDPMGLVIWGRESTDGKLRMREVHTIRTKVYGGTGVTVARAGSAFIVLHNLEPHASIVEKQHRVVARAFAAVRRPGVRRTAGNAAVRSMLKQLRRRNVAAVK